MDQSNARNQPLQQNIAAPVAPRLPISTTNKISPFAQESDPLNFSDGKLMIHPERDRAVHYPPPLVLHQAAGSSSLGSSRLISDSKFIFPDGSLRDSLSRSGRPLDSKQQQPLFSNSIRKLAQQGWEAEHDETFHATGGQDLYDFPADMMRQSLKKDAANEQQLEFDVDKEYHKSRRKWQLLQKLNEIQPNDIDLQGVFQGMNIVSSRPSTTSSVMTGSSRMSSRQQAAAGIALTARGSSAMHQILGGGNGGGTSSVALHPPPSSAPRRSASLILNTTNNQQTLAWPRSNLQQQEDDNDDLYSEFGL
jgi:hypothetical protein